VTWSAVSGTISSSGLYTSPATVPASGSDTVTATSTQDSTKSNSETITVTAPSNPIPTVASLSPASLAAGATAQTLTINGTGFLTTSTVTFNGAAHAATDLSASQLTISLTTADLATAGSYPVVVTNPTPGGGSSAAVNFTVTAASTISGVSVVCSPSSIQTNQTSTCTPTVTGTGSFSNLVSWAVSPTSMGTVSSSGVFTPSSAGTATITATSTQDLTKYGSSTVTVTAILTITSVTVACTSQSIVIGQTNQCNATVQGTGAFSQQVNWTVGGVPGGNATLGTISSTGLYDAPASIPSGGNTISISAASVEDSTQSGAAQITLVYPLPVLLLFSPSSVAAGTSDTPISLTGIDFAPTSVVNLSSQALQTTYVSTSELTAMIPAAQLTTAGNAVVMVTTPTPGGGSSAGAQFTITPVTAVAKLVLLASPASAGSPSGPWLLSAAAADSSGNPVPNATVTLNSSEGSITQNAATTDINGTFSGSITPPASYAGEVVEVSAVSGNQTAVLELVFVAASTSVTQQAAVVLNRMRVHENAFGLSPADSSSSTSATTGVSPLMMATSNGSASTNQYLNSFNPCLANPQLDTTVSVDCNDNFSTNQLQTTQFTPLTSACNLVGNIKGVITCGGAAGVLVACASPETGVGPMICAGGWRSKAILRPNVWDTLPQGLHS